MRVIIVGAGQVGSTIAANLDANHEVVVVDIDDDRVENLMYSYDVLAIEGNGAALPTLREADIERADMVIASTDDDETNIVTCAAAKTVSDAFTVARVRGTTHLDTWQEAGGAFGVDFMVSTDLLAAETVARVIGLPAARDVDTFADGSVLMAEFSLPPESPLVDRTVAEVDRFDEVTLAAVLREHEVIIPKGATTLAAGDDLVAIGSPEGIRAFAGELTPDQQGEGKDVVVVGGSEVALQTAVILEVRGLHPRLIERDPERARELAERLPHTTVLSSDATDREFLAREHIDEADVVVAALDSDEKTLLASLLADRIGVDRTIALVETAQYASLFEAVGVDAAINPRDATAEEIIRFSREGQTENVAIIDDDRAEVLEIEVDAESVLADRPIRDSAADLPESVTIGAITRDGRYVIPRGDTVIEVGDHVVLFVETRSIDTVAARV